MRLERLEVVGVIEVSAEVLDEPIDEPELVLPIFELPVVAPMLGLPLVEPAAVEPPVGVPVTPIGVDCELC